MLRNILGAIFAGLLTALAIFLLAATVVRAHSWYDPDCCHMMDCAPITSMSFVASDPTKPASMVVTTVHGTAMVSQLTKRRESKDSQAHACITLYKQVKDVRCIYLPPAQ